MKTGTRKALNFDFDTHSLEYFYPSGDANYRNGYQDVRRFLESKGFEHRQGSGYCSAQAMSMSEVTDIAAQLLEKYPWLGACIKKLDVTEIGAVHDLTYLVQNSPAPAQERGWDAPERTSSWDAER